MVNGSVVAEQFGLQRELPNGDAEDWNFTQRLLARFSRAAPKPAMSAALHELESLYGVSTGPEASCDAPVDDKHLYWYFGYGSNLNSETFLGRRGIRPKRHIRLVVPNWRLDFQIPGIPYAEPGFGSIHELCPESSIAEKSQPDLQGIAYLVTAKDYQHIIATEGGDSSYRQLKIKGIDPSTKIEYDVWTLQAKRPRQSCQPSVRYITLIREGARQHNFPQEYIDYLDATEPFILRGKKQKLGAAIFIGFWMPIVLWIFAARTALTKPDGSLPLWLESFSETVFAMIWYIHDNFWAKQFGRGDHNRSKDESSIEAQI